MKCTASKLAVIFKNNYLFYKTLNVNYLINEK